MLYPAELRAPAAVIACGKVAMQDAAETESSQSGLWLSRKGHASIPSMTKSSQQQALGHPARRREIVDAARHLAAEQGWSAVTVRAVAARVGCSAPGLYQYFRDKDAILSALAAEGRQFLLEQVEQAVAASHGAGKRLRAGLRAVWQFAQDNPELYAVMFGLVGDVRSIAAGCGPAMAVLRQAAADVAAKRDASDQTDDLADSLLAAAHGFIIQTQAGAFPGGAERAEALFLALADHQIKALGK